MIDSDSRERRRPIKQLEVMVANVIVETYDTTTLVLFTSGGPRRARERRQGSMCC